MNNRTINLKQIFSTLKCISANVLKNKKYLLFLFSFLFFVINLNAQIQPGGCPDHNTNVCDGQKVSVDVDTLPFCDVGSTSIEGDITNNGGSPSSCLDQNGNACFEFMFFRDVNSTTQSFTFDVGQGQGCNGELDASYSVYDGTSCVALSSGGSQTEITFEFPTGVNEIYIYLCVNSSAQVTMCNVCRERPPCVVDVECADLEDITGQYCEGDACNIPAPTTTVSDVFVQSETCDFDLIMESSDSGETNCVDDNANNEINIVRTYTLKYFDLGVNDFIIVQTCDQNITLTNENCCVEPTLTTQNKTICSEESIDLSTLVNSNGTVTYHLNQIDANNNDNALGNTNVSPASTTTYFVRSEVAADCYVTDTIIISLYSVTADYSDTQTVCDGGSYTWSIDTDGNGTPEDYTVSTETTTTFNVTDENGCPYDLVLTLVYDDVTADYSDTQTVCDGGSYTWSIDTDGNGTSEDYTVSTETTTTFNVADENGCPYDLVLTLAYYDVTADYSDTQTVCDGGSYTWSIDTDGNGTSEDYTVSTETTTTFNVVDENGCPYDLVLTLVYDDVTADYSDTQTVCDGGSYTWSIDTDGNGTSEDYTVSTETTTTFNVADENGCPYDLVLTLVYDDVTADYSDTQTVCDGGSYTWSIDTDGNGTSEDYTVSTETTTTFNVADENGCPYDLVLTLAYYDVTADYSDTQTVCDGGSYTWSIDTDGNGTSEDYTVSTETTTTFNVADENGCPYDLVLTLAYYDVTADYSDTQTVCDGGSYTWSIDTDGNGTSEDYTVSTETTTTFNVADENGCPYDLVLTLAYYDVTADYSDTQTVCDGGSYTFSYDSDGDGNNESYGPYTVGTTTEDVVDANGCPYQLEFTVNEQVVEISGGETVCGELEEFGFYSVDVTTNGGTVTSDYGTPTDNGGNSWTITNIPNGQNVTVTVTTDLQCESSLEIEAPDCICIELDYEYTDVSCFGLDDGTITVNYVSDGATVTINGEPYDADMLYTPGSYIIKAYYEGVEIDECIIEENIIIVEPDLVNIDAVGTDITCYGANDGTITISNLSNGAIYTIKKNGLGEDLSGQTYFGPGMYIVKAFLPQNTSNNEENVIINRTYDPCESIVIVNIDEPNPLACKLLTGFGNSLDCKNPENNWIAAKTIGEGEITYSWSLSPKSISNGWGIVDDTAGAIIEVIPGQGSATYYLSIVDETGCSTSECSINIFSKCYDAKSLKATLYPNPVKDVLNVKFDTKVNSDVTIEIFNLVGTKMFANNYKADSKRGVNDMKIDFSKFPSHVYYVKIITKQGTVIKKVVLDK